MLAQVYGTGRKLQAADLEPLLGEPPHVQARLTHEGDLGTPAPVLTITLAKRDEEIWETFEKIYLKCGNQTKCFQEEYPHLTQLWKC